MPTIDISIKDKIAMQTGGAPFIVRDNSDYVINFTFDAEWAEETAKTARFALRGGGYIDVPFTGGSVAVPVISTGRRVDVGVFAGNLHTTTSAILSLVPSIRSEGGAPVPPEDAVYDKLIALINSMGEISDDDIKQAVEGYLETNLAQPDWNQNDSTAKDYVKNRTHWMDYEDTLLLDNEQITFEQHVFINDRMLGRPLPGCLFSIKFDGEIYRCKAVSLTDNEGLCAVGNIGLIEEGAENTGEPFAMVFYPAWKDMDVEEKYSRVVIIAQTLGTHTITIECRLPQFHRLPIQYAADNYTNLSIVRRKINGEEEYVRTARMFTDDSRGISISAKEVMYSPEFNRFYLAEDVFTSAGECYVRVPQSAPDIGNIVSVEITDEENMEVIKRIGTNGNGAMVNVYFNNRLWLSEYLASFNTAVAYGPEDGGLYGIKATKNDDTSATVEIKRLM